MSFLAALAASLTRLNEKVEDVTGLGGVADEILNAKADKVRFFQRVVDIKREQDHVLAAIELQCKAVGRVARDKVHGHCLAPIPPVSRTRGSRSLGQIVYRHIPRFNSIVMAGTTRWQNRPTISSSTAIRPTISH